MKLFVTAKTKARDTEVEEIDPTHFVVRVTELAEKGRANKAILKALAAHLGVPSSTLLIVSGQVAREKIIEVF